MKTRPTTPLNAAQREALEARFALRLSARLDEGAQSVSHDITERLRVAREQAVRATREARVKAAAPVMAPTPVLVGVSIAGVNQAQVGAGMLGGWSESAQSRQPSHGRRLDEGPVSWGWRFASALPVLALVLGLWGVQRYYQHEQIQAATDVDMALLTDDLPPSAYADPGFEEFLRAGPAPVAEMPPVQPADLDVSIDQPQVSDLAAH